MKSAQKEKKKETYKTDLKSTSSQLDADKHWVEILKSKDQKHTLRGMDTTNIFKSATIDYHGMGVSGLFKHKLAVEAGTAKKKQIQLDHPSR